MAIDTVYQDFDLSFGIHPIRKDLIMRTDADAVVQALLNLVMTNHYEVPFHPEVGCNIRKLLFENISAFTARDIARFIQETVENFEPRVKIHSINVSPNEDSNAYTVSLKVFIDIHAAPISVNFLLHRVR
jgi:phage baseplate assembly protein W